MQHRDVVGRIVRHDSVVVLRVACRRIERLMAALGTANEIKTLRCAAIGLANNRKGSVVGLLHGLLPEIDQGFVIHTKAPVEALSALMAAVAAKGDKSLLQWRGRVCRLQREWSETGHQRTIVTSAAHL